jgi:hypothetical protein
MRLFGFPERGNDGEAEKTWNASLLPFRSTPNTRMNGECFSDFLTQPRPRAVRLRFVFWQHITLATNWQQLIPFGQDINDTKDYEELSRLHSAAPSFPMNNFHLATGLIHFASTLRIWRRGAPRHPSLPTASGEQANETELSRQFPLPLAPPRTEGRQPAESLRTCRSRLWQS